ncbi:MAG TPA: cytochrome c [Thermomicrobiales bacterium]|nr:cytochrome c [Thermomicrobiales bacterium]
MGATNRIPSRWLLAMTCTIAVVLLAGCGRVDLEDLTPEAVKTQQAIDAANQPTATVEPTADPNASPVAAGDDPLAEGDVAGGDSLYNAQCSGCHEGDRAASLKGMVFDPAVVIPMLRTGEGFGVPHPKYELTAITPLSDEDFIDIFAYLAAQ